ncbi:site-specific integrase [Microbacterium suaedae]|uniref:site-specific integrase n=1 Tax=Microbacterium suaedae TaxID=2067813 RepID=UPI000DA2409B|nr:site-specific integrase [Microbacterium suaedae]
MVAVGVGCALTVGRWVLVRGRRARRERPEAARAAALVLADARRSRSLDLTKDTPNGQRTLAGLVYTGLRLGELVGLRWADVDTDAGLLTVRRTFSPDGNGKLVERPTKSGQVLSVPILDELQPWLPPNDFDHVFTGIKGGAFDSGNLARAVRWHAIRDQITTFPDSEPLRFHDAYVVRAPRCST